MNDEAIGNNAVLFGIGGGLSVAAMSGIGITLGVTALISITSVIAKEVGVSIVKAYRKYKGKKETK